MALVVFSRSALAEHHKAATSEPVEFWACTFNDAKDISDLMGWYEDFNGHIDGYDDQSYSAYLMTPMPLQPDDES